MPTLSLLLLSIMYFLTARFGMAVFALQPSNITLLWLPAGIGLVMVLTEKNRALIWIAAASFLANWQGMQQADFFTGNLHTAISAIADALTPWLSATVLQKQFRGGLQRATDLFKFMFYVCFLPTLCSGVIIVSNLVLGSYLKLDQYFIFLAKIIAADSLGILLIYPLYADWRSSVERQQHWSNASWSNLVLIGLALGGVWLAFHGLAGAIYILPATALFLAYRVKAVTVSALLLSATVLLLTLSTKNLGPFLIANQDQGHFLLVSFILFTTLATQSVSIQQRQLDLSLAISESWQQKAIHDTLTGLHNRAYFENILADEWQRFGKFDRPFVVAMLDIDHFKSVNDVHGHAAGDQVLRLLATTLPHSLRQIDTVCRYGGEEFALLLPGTSIDEAKIILERLRLTIQSLVIPFESKNLQITVSIGVATSKHDMEDQNELIMVADRQLYRAKDLGRNRVECKDS